MGASLGNALEVALRGDGWAATRRGRPARPVVVSRFGDLAKLLDGSAGIDETVAHLGGQ